MEDRKWFRTFSPEALFLSRALSFFLSIRKKQKREGIGDGACSSMPSHPPVSYQKEKQVNKSQVKVPFPVEATRHGGQKRWEKTNRN